MTNTDLSMSLKGFILFETYMKWVCYMSEDRLPQWQEWLLSVLLCIVRDKPAAFDKPSSDNDIQLMVYSIRE